MAKQSVYTVYWNGSDEHLRVALESEGRFVPMDEFVQTHTPLQVSGLTQLHPGTSSQNYIGLMIAKENEKPEKLGKKPVMKATVGS